MLRKRMLPLIQREVYFQCVYKICVLDGILLSVFVCLVCSCVHFYVCVCLCVFYFLYIFYMCNNLLGSYVNHFLCFDPPTCHKHDQIFE